MTTKPPIATGLLDYFPDALAEVSLVSVVGAKQHGTQGWDRSKSPDEANSAMRHFIRRGTRDDDGQRHTAKAAWRILALLQKEIEAERLTNERAKAQIEHQSIWPDYRWCTLCGCLKPRYHACV